MNYNTCICVMSTMLTGGTQRHYMEMANVYSFRCYVLFERDYKDMGLDFSRNYYTVYVDNIDVRTVCEQHSADQFRINGKVFNVIQTEDWEEFGYNGWKRCYCVQVIDNESTEEDES